MTGRLLISQFALAGVVLVGANVFIHRSAANSVPRRLLRTADRAEPATDLFLGNSVMEAGIDTDAFAAAKPGSKSLNLGLGSTSPVEHYLLFRRQEKHRGSVVYYGFFDTELTDPPSRGWDTLEGNRSMAYYVDPEVALQYYAPDSVVKAFVFRLCSHVPMAAERYTIWARVERLRRFFGEFGLPGKDTNRFGRAEDFALLESAPEDFAARCERARAAGLPLSGPITAILELAKERGSPVVAVEMPMPSGHRDRNYSRPEWAAYQSYVRNLVREAGGTYLDASDWVGDDGFADHLHLNSSGSRVFSGRLGSWARNH